MTPRVRAVIAAAFHPPIFREMRDAKLFAATEGERQEWLRSRQFSPHGARQCSQTFMETCRYVMQEIARETLVEVKADD